jgi:hypothetical protein
MSFASTARQSTNRNHGRQVVYRPLYFPVFFQILPTDFGQQVVSWLLYFPVFFKFCRPISRRDWARPRWTATANRAICELVRLAARPIIEEGLEREATDAMGQGYYVRGAARKRTWLADL